MNSEQHTRYQRHIVLPQINASGQEKLLNAHVLILGMGGLGSSAAIYLVAAGVGQLTIVDFDQVELSNLQRQIAYRTSDIGEAKVFAAQRHLHALNPGCKVHAINGQLDGMALFDQVSQADIVLDCTDNLPTRFEINEACVRSDIPLVTGAAIRYEGQIAAFKLNQPDSPCYHCLYKDSNAPNDSCNQVGVFGPLVGIVGAMQAAETIKLLLGIEDSLNGRMAHIDALTWEWQVIRINKDPLCPTCRQSLNLAHNK